MIFVPVRPRDYQTSGLVYLVDSDGVVLRSFYLDGLRNGTQRILSGLSGNEERVSQCIQIVRPNCASSPTPG